LHEQIIAWLRGNLIENAPLFLFRQRWTGVRLKVLLRNAQMKDETKYVDVKEGQEKVIKIPTIKNISQKKIFLG